MVKGTDLTIKVWESRYENRIALIYPKDSRGKYRVVYYTNHCGWDGKNSKTSNYNSTQLFDDFPTDQEILEIVFGHSRYHGCEEPVLKNETWENMTRKGILADKHILKNFPPAIEKYKYKMINNTELSEEDINKLFGTRKNFSLFIETELGSRKFVSINPAKKSIVYSQADVEKEYSSRYIYVYLHDSRNIDMLSDVPMDRWQTKRYTNTYKENGIVVVRRHPEYDDGIVIYRLNHQVTVKDGVVTHKFDEKNKVEHVPGRVSKAVKFVRKKEVDVPVFEALNINSNSFGHVADIWDVDGPSTCRKFIANNLSYLNKSGLMHLFKNSKTPINYGMSGFFIVFVAIMISYPVFELLIKMGYTDLYFNTYNVMRNKGNKKEIDKYVKDFEKLVDNTATKGKLVFRFPSYVGDYLKFKSAKIEEFFAWRDIYELDNFSKDVFERIINSMQFAMFNMEAGVYKLPNILKYGYKTEKLINFIIKECLAKDIRVYEYLTWLGDYLNMCDLLDVKPDMYPQDVKKVHDDIAVIFRAKETEMKDSVMKKMADDLHDYVIPKEDTKANISKMWEDYTVVFPASSRDMIEEGNQQHNCVGSYIRSVSEGQCVIFFIRKKDEPHHSFITAECRKNGLGQLMYANNRWVGDDDLRKFASSICNKILTGVSSGKIAAFENVITV